MHSGAVGKYDGPPCDLCRTSHFVGVCTHRPISKAYREKISQRMKEVWSERRKVEHCCGAYCRVMERGSAACICPCTRCARAKKNDH